MASAQLRRLPTISVAVATLILLSAAAFLVHIHRALDQSARSVADAGHIAFTLGPLAISPNPGFEPITAPASFTSAAQLDGRIFMAGSGALDIYTSGGALERSFRVGIELPPAPLGSILVARLRGQSQPQVLIATAGAGILLYDPTAQTLRQLLPRSEGFRDITALAALPSGELLAGTRRHGLLSFDGAALTPFRPEYANTSITSLLTVGEEVWAGTQNHGILHTHAGVTDHFESELPDPHVETLAAADGRVFAATPVGVEMFENGLPSRILAPNVFPHAIYADDFTLTLSTLSGESLTVPLTSQRRHATSPGASLDDADFESDAQPVEQFLTLPGSDTLYAVRHAGLFRRLGPGWIPALQPDPSALTDSDIAALGFSADGRLWVGYFDRGLDILGSASIAPRHLEDDNLFCINRIVLDPRRNTMAVATANGLVLFDAAAKPRQVLTRRDGLISDHITDVVYSPSASGEERMTIATPAGLTFIDSAGVESLYAFQGLVNNHVYALAASADGGELLAGTLGGVSLLTHDAVYRNLTVANSGLRHNWITAALPISSSNASGYMVGTYGAGVMRLDPDGRFSPMDDASRDMVVNPNAMLATPTHIYAGTLTQGLWSYARASGHWTQITDGLPSLNVTAFAARDGILYVGTQNGLVRIAESKLPR